jgi:hypothetical protein
VAATSCGVAATRAPSDAKAWARAGVRFHTVSENPFFSRFAAMGRPIRPNPINPTEDFTDPPAHLKMLT